MDFFTRLPETATPEFQMFSIEHFIAIIVSVFLAYIIFRLRHKISNSKYEPLIRISFGVMLLLTNINLLIYDINTYNEWYRWLPKATCGWAIYVGSIALITKNKFLFKITFFWGYGALLSFFGPTIIEGPDKYHFYQFFFRHMGIMVAGFYFIWVFNYKIYKKDWFIYFYVTLSMTIIFSIINFIVNEPNTLNMFYTMKPAMDGTILDYLYNYSHFLYVVFWISFAALLGYLYGLPFYTKNKKGLK